tara:strand:+ start:79 stop:267 length:189 start_codon:yes stop_codon:yes gene_type:complete
MNKKPRYSELEQEVEQLKLKLANRERALSEIVVLYTDMKSRLNDESEKSKECLVELLQILED